MTLVGKASLFYTPGQMDPGRRAAYGIPERVDYHCIRMSDPWRKAKVALAEEASFLITEEILKRQDCQDTVTFGIGSGSTVAEFVPRLASGLEEYAHMKFLCVPSSLQAEHLIIENSTDNLRLASLNEVSSVDWVFDGADEVYINGVDKYMVKGGGAAMTSEKIVAYAAEKRVYLVDESKVSKNGLGERGFPVPVEVLPSCYLFIKNKLMKELPHGTQISVRQASGGKAGPVITDHGNVILDVQFPGIFDALEYDIYFSQIPGIIGHGIFTLDIDMVIVSNADGQTEIIYSKE